HDTVSPELPLYAVTRRCMGEHRCRRRPYPQSERKISLPAVRLSFAARMRVRLRSCTMREEIAYRQPDFAIVRVAYQRPSVVRPPRANDAPFERELHQLLAI